MVGHRHFRVQGAVSRKRELAIFVLSSRFRVDDPSRTLLLSPCGRRSVDLRRLREEDDVLARGILTVRSSGRVRDDFERDERKRSGQREENEFEREYSAM